MKSVFIGTGNHHKIEEIKLILQSWQVQILTPADLGVELVVEENGGSYQENALIKAQAYQGLVTLPILADDSGLEVKALDNQPGVLSARFFGEHTTAAQKNRRLLQLLEKEKDRTARFVSVVALAMPDGRQLFFWGELSGSIATDSRGCNGFGYDPIFVLSDGRRLAELEPWEKCTLSHRALAWTKAMEFLSDEK